VKFDWDNGESFSEILDKIGKMPLPPYIKREVEESDEDRYQTVFARNEGSVAAPTASLHFTDEILRKIEEKGIKTAKLTLHIGAGTFKPVDADLIGKHKMHAERVVVSKNTLQSILDALNEGRKIIPVGTTAMRSLESLYWLNGNYVEQFAPYLPNQNTITPKIKLEEIITKTKDDLQFSTELMIAPSYKFRFADGLITNFHQPKSTLLLLVAALLQEKQQANWKNLYDYALENKFRFLSYGDSCLVL
jgi:S-adenosylmethionine:tRNA ribosyltransferase-isomerase